MSAAAAAERRRVTVVGNGVAGFACAMRLAEHDLPVTLVGPGLPHDRPPLSKRALVTGRLPLLADAEALSRAGIEHLDGSATSLSLDERRLIVTLQTGEQLVTRCPGPLVWATGVRHGRPPVPGLVAAHLLATAPGFTAATARLAGSARRHVVIVGAGLVGTEAAATLGPRHEVTLVDIAERPLARLHEPLPCLAEAALAQQRVRFLGRCRIEDVSPVGDHGRLRVRTATHGELCADVVLAATGTAAAVPEALAGPAVDALRVDSLCRVVGAERVWACGDCVALAHPRLGEVSFPHWDWARRTGGQAADSIAGDASPLDVEPYWFSTIGSLHLQEVGLAERATSWEESQGFHVGRSASGTVAAVLAVDAPARVREAYELLRSPVAT